ncbi:MAG: hypothetical protein LBB76_08825 [Azoarcus sp.]|jgi:hypothetical protein|nr:hypothetical protein [Azoarcus sp.]
MRKILLYVVTYGKCLAFLGVGGILYSFYGMWLVSGDNAYILREHLQTVAGFVEKASEVTRTGKGGLKRDKYYQINVKPEDGSETLELRIRHGVQPGWVEDLIEENVTVLYDSGKEVYEVAVQGQTPQLSYEGTRDYYVAQAKSTAEITGSVWWWSIAIVMVMLGTGSFLLQRRLEARQ